MSSAQKTILNYAHLMRLSNVPTCLANALTGVAIGMQFQKPSFLKVGGVVAVICCYYCAGMILNDLCDLKYDKLHRPQRPLISGDISFRNALIITLVLFAFATAIIFFIAELALVPAVALLICIILYDFLHKKFSTSVILMGGARALVYILCAVAIVKPSQAPAALQKSLPFALILGFYTLGITIVARLEDQSRLDQRKWLAIAMPLMLFSIMFFIQPTQALYAVIAAILLGVWMIHACRAVFTNPPKIKQAILTWLSGMCLVDAWFLTTLDRPVLAIVAGLCFIVTIYGHKKVSGT